MILLWLIAFFTALNWLPRRAKIKKEWEFVYDKIKDAFGKDCQVFLTDQKYKIPTYNDVKTFLQRDKSDRVPYESEYHDCDDYSFRLMGQFSIPGWSDIAFGIAVSETHAYNVVLAEKDGEIGVYLVEPQTDNMLMKSNKAIYQTVFVMM